MKKGYLFLFVMIICTLTGCGLKVQGKENEKLSRIEIKDAEGTDIVTLERLSNEEAACFFDDEDENWSIVNASDEGLVPQYVIDLYQEKTHTVIRTEDSDAYEKIMTYTTYENSDIVKVVVSENTVHNMISEDSLTFYYTGTEEFFSTLNDAISEEGISKER